MLSDPTGSPILFLKHVLENALGVFLASEPDGFETVS